MKPTRNNTNAPISRDVTNIFYLCRLRSVESNKELSVRMRAAELLSVSESSLKNYETGLTLVVPPDVVLRMSEVYNAPELRNHYCRNMCPLGSKQVPELDTEHLHLDRLTIKLLNSVKVVTSVKESLIEIAADGIIDEDEKPQFKKILESLDDIAKHAQELRLWAEKEGVL